MTISKRTELLPYLAGRLVQMIPVVLFVLILVFVLCRVAPGDPVYFIGGASITEEYYQQIRTEFGLDESLARQFAIYLGKVLTGDLGDSTLFLEPVSNIVLERLGNTLILTLTAVALAAVAGIALGVVSSRKPHSLTDNFVSLFSLIGYSQPMFWTGMVLILFFARTGLPVSGMTTIGAELSGPPYLFDLLSHLLLPALTLAFHQMALFSRLTRSSMIGILQQDFITTARAKGLSERRILTRHGLRNAALPIVTLFGQQIGFMFAGAALVEVVFSWPGIGSLMLDAVLARDYALLSGIFLIVSITVVLANLVTDLAYAGLDPRISSR